MYVGHDATGSCINTSRRREVNFALRRSAGYSMERTSEPVGYDGELSESGLDIRGVATRKFQTPLSKIEFHHSLIVTSTEIFTGNQPSQCWVTNKGFRCRLSKEIQALDPFPIVEKEQCSEALVCNWTLKCLISHYIFYAFIYRQYSKHCCIFSSPSNRGSYTL
jgi:hypothetical protein